MIRKTFKDFYKSLYLLAITPAFPRIVEFAFCVCEMAVLKITVYALPL